MNQNTFTLTRLEHPYRNWITDGKKCVRDTEGRQSRWNATVWREDDGEFKALVTKTEMGRKALAAVFSLDGRSNVRNWILGPFVSKESAMEAVDSYIATRTDPATWRGNQSEETKRVLAMATETVL